MSVLTCASFKSAWRGYDYYKNGNVISVTPESEVGTYNAKVKGSGADPYDVELNVLHPRKTTCSCPFANGKKIICKHSVAVYFTLFPDEAKEYYQNVILAAEEAEEAEERAEKAFENYIKNLNKEQLIEIVFDLWDVVPDWVKEDFIYANDILSDDDFDDEQDYDDDYDNDEESDDDFNESVSFPLDKIIIGLYNVGYEHSNYIDKLNGNAATILDGEVLGDPGVTAEDIEYDEERFIPLPTAADINSYDIMRQFIETVDDDRIKQKLTEVIRRKGAYRKFKDEVRYLGLEKQWYKFSDEKYERAALDWCKKHNITPIK